MKVAREREVCDYAERQDWLLVGFLEVDFNHFYTWLTPSGLIVNRRFVGGEPDDD